MQSVKPPRYVAFPSGKLGIRCRSRHFHLRFRPHLVVLKSGPSKNVEIMLLAEFHIHGFARDLNLPSPITSWWEAWGVRIFKSNNFEHEPGRVGILGL